MKTLRNTVPIFILMIIHLLAIGSCKKKKEVTIPDVVSETLIFYAANNPNIQYSGRIDFTNAKSPVFSSTGVYIKAKFKGSSCTVIFKDEFKWGTERNFYNLIIDDGISYKIAPLHHDTAYADSGFNFFLTDSSCKISNLPFGEHVVTFAKRTESSIGNCVFYGFEFEEILIPDSKPTRKMEFIGNSISCGSGIEAVNGSSKCTQNGWLNQGGWGQPYHNSYLAYGPVLARMLNAEYHVTAVSGIGLYRNYSTLYDGRTMPQVYHQMFLEQNPGITVWNVNNFIPDVIVIELGANDFSSGDPNDLSRTDHSPFIDSATYVNAYIAFVNTLRSDYPNVEIFCISNPVLGDGWPAPGDSSATYLKHALKGVEDYFIGNGDFKVHKFINITKVNGNGCDFHPNVAQNSNMANELKTFVKTIIGW